MKMNDAVIAAIVKLAQEEDPAILRAALDTLLGYNAVYPVRFRKDSALEFLNPLLDLVLEHPAQLDVVKTMVDARRLEAHREIMFPPPPPDPYERNKNQRNIMRTRRLRAWRAVEIENAQRKARDKLIGHARLEFQRNVLLKWGAELKLKLDQSRHGKGDIRLKRPTYDSICAKFWADVDAAMDKQEAELRRRNIIVRKKTRPIDSDKA